MTSDDVIKCAVNGVLYSGWLSASVQAAIDQTARAFALQVTYKYPEYAPLQIKEGDLCEIYIGVEKILTGYVDAVPISYNAQGITVTVNGRSMTCDLVDCCPPPAGTAIARQSASWGNIPPADGEQKPQTAANAWHDATPETIMSALCAPYGINVRVMTDKLGDKISSFAVTPGDTVLESIAKLTSTENLVICDDEFGCLVIAEPGSNGEYPTALESGVNILEAALNADLTESYSDYVAYGQRSGSDSVSGKNAALCTALAHDGTITRPRYKHVMLTGQATPQLCAERANFEANYARAKSRAVSVKVQGWRYQGLLWMPNFLVRLKDNILDIDETMLIKSVTYNADNNGTTAVLELIDKDAYKSDAVTLPGEKTKKSGKNKKGSSDPWAEVVPIK